MGLFDWFKQTPDHIISYAPGGHTLQVKITYNTQTGLFTYRGRYGTRAKFYDKDIHHIDNKEVSRTHRVLLIQGHDTCLATLDVLTNLVNENLQAWIESRGEVAYDYDQQQRGLWVNTVAVKAAIDAGPPVEPSAIEVKETSSTVAVDSAESVEPAASVKSVSSSEISNQEDPIHRIKQLKELLDMGALTEEEFQQKKEELLQKI